MTRIRLSTPALLLGLALGYAGCGADTEGGLPDNTASAISTYAEIVHASYADSLSEGQALDTAIDSFLAEPSAAGLTAAQTAWIDSRHPYLQTEVYRFYDGPIDGADGEPEGLINAWPMDEQTVDYIDSDATTGRINDTSFEISMAAMISANGENGEADVATGFHAIEFLLWGQDLTEPAMNMPGQRPFTDYTTTENADRRGTYLATLSDLLLVHLGELESAWAPDEANFRMTFESADEAESLQKILTGMIVLAGFETAGERLQAALDAHDQEEEHSCFSDTTHTDMLLDVTGVKNIWEGRYVRVDGTIVEGTGIDEVVRAQNAELADTIDAQIATAMSAARGIQAPFDHEISAGNAEGNARVQALITALRELELSLSDAFVEFGFSIPNPE